MVINKLKFLNFDIQLFADGEITYKVNIDGKEAERSINNLSKSSDELSKKFTSFGTKMTVGVTAPLTALATAGVKYNATMETYLANLTTLMKGNEKEAQNLLNTLKEMASTTPYETTDLVKATQKMMAFGISSKDSLEYLQMIGDIAMGDANKMDSLTLAFSQIGASGRASMEDINQMIDQGFNPLTIVAQKTGESMADLRDRVSAGEVSFQEIADAMKTATSEGGIYFGSMDKASQTTAGKISTLKDDFNSALGSMTESLLPFAEKGIEKLSDLAKWFSNLDDNGKKTVLTIAGIALAIGPLSLAIGNLIKVGMGIKTVVGVIKSWHLITKMMTVAQGALNVVLNANPIALIIIAIVSLIAIIVLLWNKCEWFRNGVITLVTNIWTTIQMVGNFIMGIVTTIFNFIKTIVTTLWTYIYNTILLIVAIIATVIETIYNIIYPIVAFVYNNIIMPIINYIVGFVTTIFSIFGTIAGWIYNNVLLPIFNFFVGIFEGIWGVISNVINWIKSGFSAVADFVKTTFNNVKSFISSIFSTIGGIIKSPINGVIDLINGVLKQLNKVKVPDWVPGLGGKGINFPMIPKLATGTNYIAREGLAYLHEGEAVVPKKYNPALGGNTGATYVTVVADMDVNKFGKAFVNNVKTFSGGAKNSYNYGGAR